MDLAVADGTFDLDGSNDGNYSRLNLIDKNPYVNYGQATNAASVV